MPHHAYPEPYWTDPTMASLLIWTSFVCIMTLLTCVWRHLVLTQWLAGLDHVHTAVDKLFTTLGRHAALPVLFLVGIYSYRLAPGLSPEADSILQAGCLIVLTYGIFKTIRHVFRRWIRYLVTGSWLRRLRISILRG